MVGGEDKRAQLEPVQRFGVHGVVATPGRLKDLLNQGKIKLDLCRYMCHGFYLSEIKTAMLF